MSNSPDQRVELVSNLRTAIANLSLQDGSPSCIGEDGVLLNTFKLIGRIGSGSINGEAFKLCYPIRCSEDGSCSCKKSSTHLAVKRVPIKHPYYMKLFKQPFSALALQESLFVELLCYKLCNKLVEARITPNLPLYVNYFVCDDCIFQNSELKRLDGSPCVILINELATEGDIKTWSETPRSAAEWFNAYFQIFNALYALQKHFNITHHDLHWGNVLVHKVEKGGFWRYIIDGNTYDVPNLGFLFIIWDFGIATIPGKMDNNSYIHHYTSPTEKPRLLADYRRIIDIPFWRETDEKVAFSLPRAVKKFVENVEKMYNEGTTLDDVMTTFRHVYPKIKGKEEPLAIFNNENPLGLEFPLNRFMNIDQIKSRRPSLNEKLVTKALKVFRKNTVFVPTVRAVADQMKDLATSEDFHAIMDLAPTNYPPEPVTDINFAETIINVRDNWFGLIHKAKDITLDRGITDPIFVSKIYRQLEKQFHGIEKAFITRSKWARFIKWLMLLEMPIEDIKRLAEPVADYFADGVLFSVSPASDIYPISPSGMYDADGAYDFGSDKGDEPLAIPGGPPEIPLPHLPSEKYDSSSFEKGITSSRERRRMRRQKEKEEREKGSFKIDNFLVRQLETLLQDISDGMKSETLSKDDQQSLVSGLVRHVFSYLNDLDPEAEFDTRRFLHLPKDKYSVLSCVLGYLPPEYQRLAVGVHSILKDPSEHRYVKLFHLSAVFIEMLKTIEGTQFLISILSDLQRGNFENTCGKLE